jgi:protein-S-isoprenylcysteine O-methyltransferase Ste14
MTPLRIFDASSDVTSGHGSEKLNTIEAVAPEVSTFSPRTDWRRIAGFAIGIGTQAFFAVTVVGLFSFLRYGVTPTAAPWLLTDVLLALQFAIPHSILLYPKTRQRLRPWISSEFHGVFFCACTCISLLLIFRYWRASSVIVWDLDGAPSVAMLTGFFLSWVALLYSISLTGLGFQTGWTQWLHWYNREKMSRRDFTPRGVYYVLRHPIYLSFLGLIWFTPTMTLDHAVLTGLWTVYIAVGSVLKDQRLLYYLGESYGQYMERVAGYPGILIGPLGKRRSGDGPGNSQRTAA